MINIVLFEPEIPQNTGNIARTCAATGARLHLIGPLGFSIEDKYLKRAGLDYWSLVDVKYYDSYRDFTLKNPKAKMYFLTTKAKKCYSEVLFPESLYIVFGKETAGLPQKLLEANRETCLRIPMIDEVRSLNLSNSVAIVVYEALRQHGFENLKIQGPSNK